MRKQENACGRISRPLRKHAGVRSTLSAMASKPGCLTSVVNSLSVSSRPVVFVRLAGRVYSIPHSSNCGRGKVSAGPTRHLPIDMCSRGTTKRWFVPAWQRLSECSVWCGGNSNWGQRGVSVIIPVGLHLLTSAGTRLLLLGSAGGMMFYELNWKKC